MKRLIIIALLVTMALAACGPSKTDGLPSEWSGNADELFFGASIPENETALELFDGDVFKITVSVNPSNPTLGTFAVADNQITLTPENDSEYPVTYSYEIFGDRLTITDPETGKSAELFKK